MALHSEVKDGLEKGDCSKDVQGGPSLQTEPAQGSASQRSRMALGRRSCHSARVRCSPR